MFITIWDNIRDYLQNSISLGTVFALLVGILVGFFLAFIIYLVLIIVNIKKSDKDSDKKIKNINEENAETVEEDEKKKNQVIEYINNSISRYDDVAKGKELGEKYTEVKDIVSTLVVDIAKTYYPNSKHPLAELTVEEVIALDRYIVERIESIFEKKSIRILYNKKISTALNLLDKKKEIEENKLIKQAKRYHANDIFKTINNIVQAVNPAYWVKKGIVNTSVTIASNYIFRAIIRIIGSETAKVYSKNAFIFKDEEMVEDNIDDTIVNNLTNEE